MARRETETRDRNRCEVTMRGFDQNALGMVRKSRAVPCVRRSWPDFDGVRNQLLSVATPGFQPQRAACETDRLS